MNESFERRVKIKSKKKRRRS